MRNARVERVLMLLFFFFAMGLAAAEDHSIDLDSATVEAQRPSTLDKRWREAIAVEDDVIAAYFEAQQKESIHQYRAREVIAKRLIEREARARNRSIGKLLEDDVYNKLPSVSQSEINATLGQLDADPDDREEQAFAQEAISMANRKRAYEQYIDHLLDKYKEPEPTIRPTYNEAIRRALEGASSPALGAISSPVTVVLFADHNSPYSADIIKSLKNYQASNQNVRIVFRLAINEDDEQAYRAAQAAYCAHKQDRFWRYQSAMFATIHAREDYDFVRYAGESGLDIDKFVACLQDEDAKIQISIENYTARRLQLRQLPAVFVNGLLLDITGSSTDVLARLDSTVKLITK